MKVTVFGTGYVGLTQAVCLAQVGHSVLCMDVDAERVATLNEGHCPIFEPGLAPMLEKTWLVAACASPLTPGQQPTTPGCSSLQSAHRRKPMAALT